MVALFMIKNGDVMKIIINDLFHEALQGFIVHTSDMISKGELGRLRESFNLIEQLLISSESHVKDLIRTSYIPSLYVLLDESEWRETILELFPFFLNHEYNRHMSKFEIKEDACVFEIHLN
jgi:hypothetical protein